ncbi:MAG: hypothetical protein ACOCXA_08005, partial [Planctomycetota bacterium]
MVQTSSDAQSAPLPLQGDRLRACVRRGNIRRDHEWLQGGQAFVPVYVANGAFGGCVDAFGLHGRANYDMDQGRTHLAHTDHYSQRHDNGGHVLRSLLHLIARDGRDEEPGLGLLEAYEQELDLWTASCSSSWQRGSRFRSEVFASWDVPQLWCWELQQELRDAVDALQLRLVADVRAAENNARKNPSKRIEQLTLRWESRSDGLWQLTSSTDCCSTRLLIAIGGAEVRIEDSDLCLTPGNHCQIRILACDRHLPAEIAEDPAIFLQRDDHRQRHEAAVAKHWQTSGMLELPADCPEASWWPRFAYYLPASLSPQPSHIQVAHGLNANNWGHGFPQDQWYVMMALPRLGLHARSAAQLPYYNDDLDAYRRYTQRMTKRPGVFFPWEAPFENLDGFELDGPTNVNSYQFHNAAYVVAMVWEAYLVSRDEDFLRRHADLIAGVTEFYLANIELSEAGAVFRNDDIPLRSQDEATVHGAETVQPLCSVWASLYTFDAYLRSREMLGLPDNAQVAQVRRVLEQGFDWSGLEREDGSLRTSASDPRPFGQQKHPPQLNPLTYLPMAQWMADPRVVRSWRRRHDLCKFTRLPKSLGWTFAQLALASARMQDGAGVQQDLDLVQP